LRDKTSFEVLVILNGCKDNTLKIVRGLSKKYKEIIYEDYPEAIGKGGAIIQGFKIAKGSLIGFVDADLSTKPKDFYDLIIKMGDNDGIIASRWIKGSKLLLKQPLSRRIASRSFNFLIRILFNIKIKDTQCGAKLFKAHAIKDVLNKIGLTKWAFDIDLIYHLKKQGYKIKEAPTNWTDDPRTKLNIRKASIEMFSALLRLRLMYSPFKFIIKLYDRLPEKLKIHHKL